MAADWIAKLTKDGKTLAVLTKSGKWQSERDAIATYLDLHFDPHRATGVGAILPLGHYAAALAADRLGVEVEYSSPVGELPADLIS